MKYKQPAKTVFNALSAQMNFIQIKIINVLKELMTLLVAIKKKKKKINVKNAMKA